MTIATMTFTKKRKASRGTDAGPGDEEPARSVKWPFAPPKEPPRGPKPASTSQTLITRATNKDSDWYGKIDMTRKYSRGDLVTLQLIGNLVIKCRREAGCSTVPESLLGQIRVTLHRMEFFDFVSHVLIKKSKVLDDEVGLPQIFNGKGAPYPWDIKADAQALYLRWLRGVIDPHLLRGIESSRKQRATGTSGITHKLEQGYLARVLCNVIGDNGLQNGQWWPMQICALRDGAHGEIEAGIHGKPGQGAISVILSGGGYADVDEGDRIFYCGTSGSGGEPSSGTKHLKLSHQSNRPVRVLRSAALPQKNPYRPAKGLRYDGLYDIVQFAILDAETAMHRFDLQRCAGQDPIRYRGVEARPTHEEVEEYGKIRKLMSLAE